MNKKKLRAIVLKDGEFWVAQGLEHDICVQANSLDDLYGRFEIAVCLEAKEEGGLDRIDEAPRHFFDLWDNKSSSIVPSKNTDTEYGLAA